MGPYLSEPIKAKSMHKGVGNGFSFCVSEMQGWRKTMEDAAIYEPNLDNTNSLFAVFDGHGGHQVSKYVADRFAKLLTSRKAYSQGKYIDALDEAFKLMDEVIQGQEGTKFLNQQRNIDAGDPISKNTGCTANVVLITPNKYIVANAGDSRSVLCRKGKAVDLSFDHKPESEEEEKRIKKAGGVVYMGRVNGGLNLTRSFGDFDYKKNSTLGYDEQMITCKPDIREYERNEGDEFIIVGCDGIWEKYVQNSQGLIDIVRDYIGKGKANEQILELLLDQLLAKDTMSGLGCDNMTSLIVRFK